MSNNLTRRALIGGASVAAVALAVPATGAVNKAASFPADWSALVAEHHRLDALARAAGDCFDAAECAFADQRKPEAAKGLRLSPINEHMTIAQIKAMPAELFGDDDADWRAWRAEANALHARIVGPASDAWTAALRNADAAMAAVQAYPSVSPAMLAEKVCLLAEHYGPYLGDDPGDLVHILADARRFTGREG